MIAAVDTWAPVVAAVVTGIFAVAVGYVGRSTKTQVKEALAQNSLEHGETKELAKSLVDGQGLLMAGQARIEGKVDGLETKVDNHITNHHSTESLVTV